MLPGGYGDSNLPHDTGPLHVSQYQRHADALTSAPAVGTATTLAPPAGWERAKFLRLIPLGGAVVYEVGLSTAAPGNPVAGSTYVPDGAVEFIQLPRPTSGTAGEKPQVKVSGVGGAVNVQATWVQ